VTRALALAAILILAHHAETRAAAAFATHIAPARQLLAAVQLVAALSSLAFGVECLRRRAGWRPWSWYGCAVLSAALTFAGAALHVPAVRDAGPDALYGIVAVVAWPALRPVSRSRIADRRIRT